MSKEIYDWLKAQKYQTEYEATGEYRMYFEVDMPKILEAYYEWKVKKLNKPAVSIALPTQSELQETVEKIAYNQLAEEQIDDLVCKMQILDEYVKKYLKTVGNEC